MVLIISKDLEPSTDKVIDWLRYLKVPFRRVNGTDMLNPGHAPTLQVSSKQADMHFNGEASAALSDITAVWYRRDGSKPPDTQAIASLQEAGYYQDVVHHLSQENAIAKKALYALLASHTRILGSFSKSSVNKIEVLINAQQQGLDVPATLITRSKKELQAFMDAHPIITKALWESPGITIQEEKATNYTSYTEEVTPDMLQAIPEEFFYSLFQEKLDKELDLRVFYLDGDCYTMAIFSQMNQQTKVDFRKYANNRNVPYQLPADIEQLIVKLMKAMQLNTGSLDFVKTRTGRYVFLEVNPVGQYDMTSVPCNYQLDKKIAQYLSQHA
ncbi:grasp-with-spasm system ATP-grasp peptide maturase [Chitinophaga rhizophila]|uniref:Grasp-with-spasm system ATP-grasp peptide maturase n=1 Tax=Chitinophaga rhizophila TaxID=2866212 RepID=A0ABS7GJS9_9BACT|nr:grasp-with-spasm system ATP-grasp peptide maturase [Chitinophaga rhizophila]MBW8687987.1 grasp-with-spasm system ATP-grasp peptide maturase [Chitinophaga rhizophila]